jgi:hypothetical protein
MTTPTNLDNERLLELFFSQSLDGFFFMMLDEPVEWGDHVDKEKVLDYVFANERMTKLNSAIADQFQATPEQLLGPEAVARVLRPGPTARRVRRAPPGWHPHAHRGGLHGHL